MPTIESLSDKPKVNSAAERARVATRELVRRARALKSSGERAVSASTADEASPSRAADAVESVVTEAAVGPEPAAELSLAEFRRAFEAAELDIARWPEASISASSVDVPACDPTGPEYHEFVLRLWSAISERGSYDAEVDEAFDLDEEFYLAHPFPYSSRDPVQVSQYFGTVAETLTRLGGAPPRRVVEFGSGWGHLALAAAATGFDVTAVDLNPPSVSILRRRAAALGVPLKVEQSDFTSYEVEGEIDTILFFEAFHHCARPFELLDRCVDSLAPGGRMLFVADAIYDHFYADWGPRLDGSAAIMMAQEGWLELGFRRSFFEAQLAERGLSSTWEVLDHLGAYGTFLTARKPER